MIDGEIVRLRAVASPDFSTLAKLRSDEELAYLLESRARASAPESIRGWVDRVTGDPASLLFAIAECKTDDIAGFLHIKQIDLVSGTAMFGICISREYQGRGMGREALTLLEAYLGRVWNLRKLTLNVLTINQPAIGLYRSLGFTEVGTMSQHFWFDGKYQDVMVMEHIFKAG